MATLPEDSSSEKKHTRHGSGRASIVRRSTKGPLDSDESPLIDPLSRPSPISTTRDSAQSQLLSPTAITSSQSQFPTRVRNHSPRQQMSPRLPSPQPSNLSSNPSFKTAHSTLSVRGSVLAPVKDFGYLLRPEIYHPLTLLDVPPPFRTSALQPDPATPLEDLVRSGHFRAAAIKAAQQLTSSTSPISPADHEQIFNLVYIRLSCLTLCNQTTLASQEVKALEDLNSVYYLAPDTIIHLVPWPLRVLAVRLQGIGFSDARRGVMGFYDLAREARLTLSALKKSKHASPTSPSPSSSVDTEIELWTDRLADLGIRVVSALIEMDDLSGAARHLSTLSHNHSPSLAHHCALLYLHLGDISSARACLPSDKAILALAHMADNEPELAIPLWESLIEDNSSALYRQNLAVCWLYCGELNKARTILEDLVSENNSFHALTFNLSTIYELCTERSRSLKIGLAERVAGIVGEERERGWEKVNGDFKL